MKHEITIEDRSANHEKYNWLIVCSCGWTGRTHSMQEANATADHHLNSQAYLSASGGIRAGGN